MKPGIYPGLPMAEYLAIDALSATPARILLDQCPRAGWFASKMNPELERDEADVFDIGTVAHSGFLEDSFDGCMVIDPKDYPTKSTGNIPKGWTNNEIKAARDSARAAGKTPLLVKHFDAVSNMVGEARVFVRSLKDTEPAIYGALTPGGGDVELTMVWQEANGLLCKLRADCISADRAVVVDYKTAGTSVEPSRFARSHLVNMGYYFNAAWYRRGINALCGVVPTYVFLAQETAPPYLCSLPGLDPETVALGDEKVNAALKQWGDCVASGKWPGYPARVCFPPLPVYERMKWDERVIITADGVDYASQA